MARPWKALIVICVAACVGACTKVAPEIAFLNSGKDLFWSKPSSGHADLENSLGRIEGTSGGGYRLSADLQDRDRGSVSSGGGYRLDGSLGVWQ